MRLRGTTLPLIALLLALPLPALATTYYVRPGGSDSACTGTTDADHTSGSSCAWSTINKCDTTVNAGDTCQVAAGNYGQALDTAASGTSSSRIVYVCPSRNCVVSPSSGDSLDLRNRSWITVDGFTFEDGMLEPWGGSSQGILLDNITTRDQDNQPPYATIFTGGGSDNTLRNFNLDIPPDNSSKPNVANIGVNASTSELRTLLQNGVMKGSWNNLALKSCTDCTLDGVKLTGAKNHTLDLGNGGTGIKNLTFKNCVIMASTGFRENNPQVLGPINGLNVINNAILAGYLLPSIGHETQLSGKIVVRNNIFFNPGVGGGEMIGQVNNDTSVTWDIDYNAYAGAANFNTATWRDTRNGTNKDYYADVNGNGIVDNAGGSDMDDWQAMGFDQNSIVIANTDYRTSTAQYASAIWGANGASWGAMVECSVDSTTFETHDQWGEAIAVGDIIEYGWDGVPRTVTAVSQGSGGGSCSKRVDFTPALSSAPKQNSWFLSWGRTVGTGKSYVPVAGSTVIDAGDDGSCGHTRSGPHCDIGPVEYSVTSSDTTPPSTPGNLSVSAGGSSVSLTWNASSDNVGVSGYDVMRSTTSGSGYVFVGTSSGTSFSDTTGIGQTVYYYVVRAYDAAGNRSGNSNQVSITFPGTAVDNIPPTPPAGLTALGTSASIDLAWAASTDNVGVTAYSVLRSTKADSGYASIATLGGTTLLYSDISGAAGKTYFYKVRAADAAGNVSSDSNVVSATMGSGGGGDITPPTAPASLSATGGNAVVDLAWAASTDDVAVTGYDVLRSKTNGSGYAKVGSSATTLYSDTTAKNGTTYYYVVQAFDAAGNRSGNSPQAQATPKAPGTGDTQPPTAPSGLAAVGFVGGVDLSWSAATDNVGVTGYTVYRSTTSGFGYVKVGSSTGLSFGDLTVLNGVNYFYVVTAMDAAGNESPDSNEAAATPGGDTPDTIPPTTPAGLLATGESNGVSLSWGPATDNRGFVSYEVHRSTTKGSGYQRLDSAGTTTYFDSSAVSGTTYYYVILALDKKGNQSGFSNEASARRGEFIVISSAPSNNQGGVTCGVDPSLVFSEMVDPATVTQKSVRLLNAATGAVIAQATGSPALQVDGQTVTITTLYPLNRGVTYKFDVVPGSKAVKSLAGKTLTASYASQFRVAPNATCSPMPFEVVSTAPVDDAVNVSTAASIQIVFLSPVNGASVKSKSVKISSPTGSKVKLAGAPAISADGLTLTVTPLNPMAVLTQYVVELKGGAKGVKGTTGQPLPDTYTFAFTTSAVAAASQMELGVSN